MKPTAEARRLGEHALDARAAYDSRPWADRPTMSPLFTPAIPDTGYWWSGIAGLLAKLETPEETR